MTSTNSVGALNTATCLVCHEGIDVKLPCSAGLKTWCGHWHCEPCMTLLGRHCSVCDRDVLNRPVPCQTCGTLAKMYQTRSCIGCGQLCCVSCARPEHCCFKDGEAFCSCCTCPTCVTRRGDHEEIEPCICCGEEIDADKSPRFQLPCGHWQCEQCIDIFSGHCNECQAEKIKEPWPCMKCDTVGTVAHTRTCCFCDKMCCTWCSEQCEDCCERSKRGEPCQHACCDDCTEYESD